MGTIWRAIVWLMAVAVLHLRLTWAAERGRQLAQDDSGTQPVSTAEELKHAIINKIANIHFTYNFTFPQRTFPGAESICCLDNSVSMGQLWLSRRPLEVELASSFNCCCV